MACGSEAVLSHRSAADLWGLRPSATRLEVTVIQISRRTPDVQIHRSRILTPKDVTVKDGIPVTSVARTLLDLSAVLHPDDLEVAVDRAERLGLFDLTAVIDVLQRATGRRGAGALRRTVEVYRLSTQKSELERRLRKLLHTAVDIPSAHFNALVQGATTTHEVDAYWPAHRLAVQVDGFEFHHTRRDRERDAASDADLELAGHRVMRLTWDDTTVHGDRTLQRVRLALRGARLSALAGTDDIHTLPDDLPVPEDDGAADHLLDAAVPPIPLAATTGETIRLDEIEGRTVLFCYPRTGRPDEELPPGWNAIPGARGCTPEACGFRDAHAQFADLGTRVLALSTQSPEYQQEMADRLHLPFPVLSDEDLELTNALRLPTFETSGWTLLKRLTLVIDDGRISHVFYPVFPPDGHAAEVLDRLRVSAA
jgi:peroxiredoxin/very-short-patch-repair endonuclease